MASSFKHDPLTAISEADATGETARLFADIRDTMQLPLLTSIWRTLAGVDGGLSSAWKAAKPVFTSGFPELLLAKFRNPTILPIPSNAARKRLDTIQAPYRTIKDIIDVYTRSNSLNFLVLSALYAEPAGNLPGDIPITTRVPTPDLPALLEQKNIAPTTWQLLQNINRFGATPDQPGLATLWRHLSYWPDVLSVFYDALIALQEDASITDSITSVLEIAHDESQRLALIRPDTITHTGACTPYDHQLCNTSGTCGSHGSDRQRSIPVAPTRFQ